MSVNLCAFDGTVTSFRTYMLALVGKDFNLWVGAMVLAAGWSVVVLVLGRTESLIFYQIVLYFFIMYFFTFTD